MNRREVSTIDALGRITKVPYIYFILFTNHEQYKPILSRLGLERKVDDCEQTKPLFEYSFEIDQFNLFGLLFLFSYLHFSSIRGFLLVFRSYGWETAFQ